MFFFNHVTCKYIPIKVYTFYPTTHLNPKDFVLGLCHHRSVSGVIFHRLDRFDHFMEKKNVLNGFNHITAITFAPKA